MAYFRAQQAPGGRDKVSGAPAGGRFRVLSMEVGTREHRERRWTERWRKSKAPDQRGVSWVDKGGGCAQGLRLCPSSSERAGRAPGVRESKLRLDLLAL